MCDSPPGKQQQICGTTVTGKHWLKKYNAFPTHLARVDQDVNMIPESEKPTNSPPKGDISFIPIERISLSNEIQLS
jgi:hypothetical protein